MDHNNLLEDPLDRDDFDPVQFLNQKFPTEASLDTLDVFVADISSQISSLDKEISDAIQNQSIIGTQGTQDIENAQQYIEDLFVKIGDIKIKASQSELMVQDLCADIKKLDCAKNHLQTSITSLNRLQMLINAVNQLELMVEDYQYREAANLLDAVKQFMSHFEKYQHINVIIDLNKRVAAIRAELTKQIRVLFNELAENIDKVADADLLLDTIPGGMKALTDSCLVVDALGFNIRRDLLHDFVHRQLVPYESLFGQEGQHFTLDQVERRWAWFKRLLKYIDSKFSSIFPNHWRIQLRLCLEFVENTKMHLILMLTEMESTESTDVNLLLKALQSSLRFEKDMTERFNLLNELKKSVESEEIASKIKAQEAAMQKRLKKDDKLMYIPTDHDAMNKEEETESGFLGLANAAVSGGISGVFDKFLGSYVLLERQNLEEMLTRLGQEEDNASGEATAGHVYTSSTNMFMFIKNSIKRCTALTTGQTFLSLSEELRGCMRQYIVMLKNRCPPEISQNPPVFRLVPGGEIAICYLINTGEYCAEVVPQLEEMVQQKIVPTLASKVNFSNEADMFMDLVAHCLKVLVYGILDRIEPALRTMQQINWGAFSQVGEESAYVHAISGVLVEAIPNIRSALSSSYFINFCTKLATEIFQRYLDCILRQKRICDLATQQLLLDTYALKTLVLQMPVLNPSDSQTGAATKDTGRNVSPVYAKLVNARSSHIEIILKLLGTPEEMLLERFRIMWPEGQPTDLQIIMGLKGTKRNDQQAILEMFGLASAKNTSSKTTLNIPAPTASYAGTTSFATTAASAQAASAAAFSSMKSLTQDLSSSARNAVGNLKWAK